MTTKQLVLFCIIFFIDTSKSFAKPFTFIISNANIKYNCDFLNIRALTLADTNYGRHQSMVRCIKKYIQVNKWKYEKRLELDSLRMEAFDKSLKIAFDAPTVAEKYMKNSIQLGISSKELGAISLPEDPKKWNKSHLKAMAISKTGFDEGFGCLILLYYSAIVTDKNGNFLEDALLARKALFNEFTPISLSAQSKIDDIIYQNKNNKMTKAEAVPKLVEIRESELNTFMNVIKEVAIETKEKRQELKNLKEKKN